MLKRIKIQGYKSLVDLELDLKPLSVLVGPNASGKSNFLDALQLLSRIATCHTLEDAFKPPYRGHPLESFTFGGEGIKSLLEKERVSFSIEVDVQLSNAVIESVNQRIQKIRETAEKDTQSADKPVPKQLPPVREEICGIVLRWKCSQSWGFCVWQMNILQHLVPTVNPNKTGSLS